MSSFSNTREWIAAAVFGAVLLAAVVVAIIGFSLDGIVVLLLAVAVLSGGLFGELRDTWNTERQFDPLRVFFRTFEWLSLAIAGYIILSVIGVNANTTG